MTTSWQSSRILALQEPASTPNSGKWSVTTNISINYNNNKWIYRCVDVRRDIPIIGEYTDVLMLEEILIISEYTDVLMLEEIY